MLSVDPVRDEGAEIASYVGSFTERGHALRAANQKALEQAAAAFGVLYEIEEHDPGAAVYDVGHSATVFAVDQDGHIVWEFTYPTAAQDVADALVSLFAERY